MSLHKLYIAPSVFLETADVESTLGAGYVGLALHVPWIWYSVLALKYGVLPVLPVMEHNVRQDTRAEGSNQY